MPDVQSALASVAADRARDPLSPVTFVVPSHAAGLQLRRRLARHGPFAAVRFETLPRLAELIAAGELARAGRSPLARPIGDYVAQQVALESEPPLSNVRDLPGYARVLRQHFRRLRRGGIRSGNDARGGPFGSHLDVVLRLYSRFRDETADFYDDEDLLDAAADAVLAGSAGVLGDIGALYVVPPGPLTAGGHRFLEALEAASPAWVELDDPVVAPSTRITLSPDPASEVREVVREVVRAIEDGAALQDIAVFHGANAAYPDMLREQFEAAAIPCVPLPGVPLSHTPLGRAALLLAGLPAKEYARTAVMDFLHAAPLPRVVPGADGPLAPRPAQWGRLSRRAGIVGRIDGWQRGLAAAAFDLERERRHHQVAENASRLRAAEFELAGIQDVSAFISALTQRLEPLRQAQPAAAFIAAFTDVVRSYLDDRDPAFDDLLHEIEQLGTVDAVRGTFTLDSFLHALSANLDSRYLRPRKLGDGVIITDYRGAAALQFSLVLFCAGHEGAVPAGPGPDPLIEDHSWVMLKNYHPHIEDKQTRIKRAELAVSRAVAAAGEGTTVWFSPRAESAGTRDYYPSPHLVEAASVHDPAMKSSSQLRGAGSRDGWLYRGASPLSMSLRGPVANRAESAMRQAASLRRATGAAAAGHRNWTAVKMLRARRSSAFTEWDGNLAGLAGGQLIELQRALSPTSLEHYASCGFRYLCRSVWRLNVVEEPEERQVMDPTARGSLVHTVLERFFAEVMEAGRPAVDEEWTQADEERLMTITDEELAAAKERGLTGLDVYLEQEARTIRSDLRQFLEYDAAFRRLYGVRPHSLETAIPEIDVGGLLLRGRADRVDMSPDGTRAVVIDYKTGSLREYEAMIKGRMLAGGTKLQLPVYLAAAEGAESAHALYWFITQRGGFTMVEYFPTPDLELRYQRTLKAIVAGVQEGRFPIAPGEYDEFYNRFENCGFCDFDRICSRRRDYEFGAKMSDPQLVPWTEIAGIADGEGGQSDD